MDESGVNHSIRRGGSTPQAGQILKIATMDLGTSGGKRLGSRIRASEAENLMARFDEFCNDGRADESCRTSDEYTHGNPPSMGKGKCRKPRVLYRYFGRGRQRACRNQSSTPT